MRPGKACFQAADVAEAISSLKIISVALEGERRLCLVNDLR